MGKSPRYVKVNRNPRDSTKGFSLLRCEDCNSILVTAGRLEDELVKCPVCTWVWSLNRLGLIMSEGKYYVKEE